MSTARAARREPAREYDWQAIEQSPSFRELRTSRRRFTVPAVAFFAGYFLAALLLIAYAGDTLSKPALGSVTWALLLGLSMVVVTFVMAALYARKSREWVTLADRVVAEARGPSAATAAHSGSIR